MPQSKESVSPKMEPTHIIQGEWRRIAGAMIGIIVKATKEQEIQAVLSKLGFE
jgi:hypothetical protein